MNVFNRNIKFLRKKEGFKSVQKFADFLDEPRSKVAEYERKAIARPEFLQKLVDRFGIDINTLLTIELDDLNYSRLKTSKNNPAYRYTTSKDDSQEDFYEIAQRIKGEDNPKSREELIQRLIRIHAKKLDVISDLKDEVMKQLKEKEELFRRI